MVIRLKVLTLMLFVTFVSNACYRDSSNSEFDSSIQSCAYLGIEGRSERFLSVNDFEVGIYPGGITKGKWIITFVEDRIQWQHSDVLEEFNYDCVDSRLLIAGDEVNTVAGENGKVETIIMNEINYDKER